MTSRASHPICFQSQWENSGLTVSVAVSGVSNVGGADNRENQDAFFTIYDPKNTALVVGIFDGHGKDTGRDIAHAAKQYFEAQFQGYSHKDYARLERDPEEFFQHLFTSCHQALKHKLRDLYERAGYFVEEKHSEGYLVRHNWHTGTMASVRGGTTATIVVILNGGRKIYSANVGDSAVLLTSMSPALHADDVKVYGNDGDDVYRQNKSHRDEDELDNNCTPESDLLLLSGNHSPESTTEFFRARSARCSSLDPTLPALRFVYDTSEPKGKRLPIFTMTSTGDLHRNSNGEYYKNVRNEWATVVATPCNSLFPDALAFTRSLGDFQMHSYGVSCNPTVVELSLELIVARDLGLTTQAVSNQEYSHSSTYDNGEVRTAYASNNTSENSSEHSFMVLVASDGIWDNWKYCELQTFLSEANRNKSLHQQSEVSGDYSPVDVCISSLMDVNLQRASNYFGENADNMTAFLCNFNVRI
ncbi:hypothetical protein PPTG_10988 [Phytophthora nicotianae INRA-310]|uniref:PPM-type phosphatase domain-containing protein n=1 Tax=Phytophthora nicotianae (strain INRA-310) TaxID=761204 RepID=W2Q9G6_PHYN3|nr:hypothetical protein PPTG_10988 [Phytophthora nicotianae INRA-310]ETN08905.1 hypothetical protein PPTG_10988 [Phytophthora nicotianae INRA-310]